MDAIVFCWGVVFFSSFSLSLSLLFFLSLLSELDLFLFFFSSILCRRLFRSPSL